MAQGESPRNPLAFASVSCPGRCLASQPIHLGSEVEQYPSDSSRYTPRKEARVLLTTDRLEAKQQRMCLLSKRELRY